MNKQYHKTPSGNHEGCLPRAGATCIFGRPRIGSRKGFILHEAMMAVGIAMVLIVGATQLLVMVTTQQRLARQYAIATHEVGNLMEQVATQSWEDTTSQNLASLTLPETCNQHLPNASLSVEMVEEDTATRRITIAIEWQIAPERSPDSVQLVGWRFLAEEDES